MNGASLAMKCTICLEDIYEGEEIVTLPDGEKVHEECGFDWALEYVRTHKEIYDPDIAAELEEMEFESMREEKLLRHGG